MSDPCKPVRTAHTGGCIYVIALASMCFARVSGEVGFSTSQFCTGITSVKNLQDVISADTLGQSVCIKFIGDAEGEVWKLHDSPALDIKEDQYVYIDCGGRYFDYHSKQGELAMGKGSTLHYFNCSLLDYDFPDTNRVYGTIHAISSSIVGMQDCQVVRELGDQYAPVLSSVQPNASIETGRLIDNANGSAVYIFLTAFDSLAGPQIRYEIEESTIYCKSNASVPEAIRVANEFGPEVIHYSADVLSQGSDTEQPRTAGQDGEGNSGSDTVVVLGLASYLLWYVKHKLGARGPGPGATDATRYLAKHYGASPNDAVSSSQMGPTSGSIDGRRYVPPNQ